MGKLRHNIHYIYTIGCFSERHPIVYPIGSFTPLVMSATGGLAPAASVFYKKLASMIAMKRGHPYGMMMNLIRRRLAFSLLRSSSHAIRGSRSSYQSPIDCAWAQVNLAEGHF